MYTVEDNKHRKRVKKYTLSRKRIKSGIASTKSETFYDLEELKERKQHLDCLPNTISTEVTTSMVTRVVKDPMWSNSVYVLLKEKFPNSPTHRSREVPFHLVGGRHNKKYKYPYQQCVIITKDGSEVPFPGEKRGSLNKSEIAKVIWKQRVQIQDYPITRIKSPYKYKYCEGGGWYSMREIFFIPELGIEYYYA